MIVGTKRQFYDRITDEWLGDDLGTKNLETFQYLLEDCIDFVDCKDPVYFPKRVEHFINIPMEYDYYQKYKESIRGKDKWIFF